MPSRKYKDDSDAFCYRYATFIKVRALSFVMHTKLILNAPV